MEQSPGKDLRGARTLDRPSSPAPDAISVNLGCIVGQSPGRLSDRVAETALRFGIPLHGNQQVIIEHTVVPIRPGQIVVVLGPSGSGKTTALAQFERALRNVCSVERIRFPEDVAVLDRISPGSPFPDAAAILTGCALSEPGLWVRPYSQLSEGERFRARLARAVSLQCRASASSSLICDEFCCGLHRRAARAIAVNLRKLAERNTLTVIAATCDEGIAGDLRPNVLIRLMGQGRCRVEQHRARRIGLARRVRIEPGGKRDYDQFAAMHYRRSDELGFVDRVFVLRERAGDETLGIVVYAYSPAELALRNQTTGGIFKGNPRKLNRSMRILRRLVIHPDVRGCGLGHYLVRKTLPLVGTRFVECLASLGVFNPVFEKAGMKKIGRCAVPRKQRVAIEKLAAIDVDPNGRDFAIQIGRKPLVRRIVAGVVFDWYAATTGGAAVRAARQDPQTLARIFRGLIGSEPVYYLWTRSTRRPPEAPAPVTPAGRMPGNTRIPFGVLDPVHPRRARCRTLRANPDATPQKRPKKPLGHRRKRTRKDRHHPERRVVRNAAT